MALIARYNFIDGSFNDVSGNGYHATATGAPTANVLSTVGDAQGCHRDSITLNGTSQYLTLSPHVANLAPATGIIVMRIRIPSTQAGTDTYWSFYNDSTGEWCRGDGLSNGRPSFLCRDASSLQLQITRNTALDDDQWHTLASQFGTGGFKAYLDGVDDTSNWTASTGSIASTDGPASASANSLYIGQFQPGNPLYAECELSEFRIYDAAEDASGHAAIHLDMLPTAKVVLIVGDSNGVGSNTGTASIQSDLVVSDTGSVVAKAADPLVHQNTNAGSVGFGIRHARLIADNQIGDKEQVRIVPAALSGSDTGDWQDGQTAHDNGETRMANAWARLNTAESSVPVVIVSLGANNTDTDENAAAAEDEIVSAVESIRTWDGITADTVFLLMGMSPWKLTLTRSATVEAGIQAAANRLANCYYVPLSDADDGGADVHFDAVDMPLIASRLYAAAYTTKRLPAARA